MERLIALDDAAACDPAVSGHKAAELARATAAGLPALPGWVLPLGESAAPLAAGRSTDRDQTRAAGILTVSSIELDGQVTKELTALIRSLGGSVVVRSSSVLEGDPRWSGAFSTYLDVGPDDIVAAVRGCWASVFTRDAAARGAFLEVDPAEAGMAVLIQPFVRFDGGGVASLERDGGVTISFATGPPSDLLSGRSVAVPLRLSRDDDPSTVMPVGMEPPIATAVVDLVNGVHAALGDDTIEWGVASGAVALLQARRAARTDRPVPAPRRRRRYPPVAARIARAAARCPGPLGEAWVLPWGFTLDRLPRSDPLVVSDVCGAIAEARVIAEELVGSTWPIAAGRSDPDWGASLRLVLGSEPFRELDRLSTFPPADQVRAARLLGLADGIGRTLHGDGVLDHAEQVWRLTPTELERAASGGEVALRTGPERWEPFVFSVAHDRGRTSVGRSASPGIGAGRAFIVDVSTGSSPPPRRVVVVSAVVPQLASLVWEAAGLVAGTGDAGAHLFEVARSLGVPAVIGIDPDTLGGKVLAVDGDEGTVSVLDPWQVDERPLASVAVAEGS